MGVDAPAGWAGAEFADNMYFFVFVNSRPFFIATFFLTVPAGFSKFHFVVSAQYKVLGGRRMATKRQAIVEAATILFAERGYRETAVAELARLTGAAEGTVFYHFNTKADLFLAVLAHVKEGILSEFDQYMGESRFSTGMEMMEKVISFFLYLAGHHEPWFMLLQRHHPYEAARENEDCRNHLAVLYNTLLDLFEGAIVRGQQDGSIAAAASRKTALLVFSMVHGLVWLKFNDLYDAAVLYEELLASCRRMLSSPIP